MNRALGDSFGIPRWVTVLIIHRRASVRGYVTLDDVDADFLILCALLRRIWRGEQTWDATGTGLGVAGNPQFPVAQKAQLDKCTMKTVLYKQLHKYHTKIMRQSHNFISSAKIPLGIQQPA